MRTVNKTAKCTDGSVTLELIDALELSEVLDYLFDWLHGASDAVRQDLITYGSHPNAVRIVKNRLTAFSQLLIWGEADLEQDDEGEDDQELTDRPDHEQDEPW